MHKDERDSGFKRRKISTFVKTLVVLIATASHIAHGVSSSQPVPNFSRLRALSPLRPTLSTHQPDILSLRAVSLA